MVDDDDGIDCDIEQGLEFAFGERRRHEDDRQNIRMDLGAASGNRLRQARHLHRVLHPRCAAELRRGRPSCNGEPLDRGHADARARLKL
jgi:hypothetical protein